MTELLLLLVFIILFACGVPIAFAIGLATLAAMAVSIDLLPAASTIAQRMAGGVNSFALLAIPLFILSGNIMSRGGIAQRLIAFARNLIGSLPGGMGLVNVLSCTLFGAISGSAVASTSAVGGVMIPAMENDGYERPFGAALTAAASTTGLLIPPSNILIVYALASGGVSITALFLGGYMPGLLVAAGLVAVCSFHARRSATPGAERVTGADLGRSFIAALPSLALIGIVMGGIVGGVFTATEAGAIAVLYALGLSLLYRELALRELPVVLLRSVITTATVMLLVGTSIAMSWLLAYQNVPGLVAATLLTVSDNPLVVLLLINLVLLVVGSFMDMTPAVMIFTPIFLPVAVAMDMSPLHFGIMLVLNLSIGLCTPPVGSVLFVSSAVAGTPLGSMIRPLLPMYAVMLFTLALVTYVPALSELLPQLAGMSP